MTNDNMTQLLTPLKDEKIFDNIHFIDYFRYDGINSADLKKYLARKDGFWSAPGDTGFCSTNCLINDIGIYTYFKTRGYHNYAAPLSWECRLGLISRGDGFKALDIDIDIKKVREIYHEINYRISDPEASFQDAVVVEKKDEGGNSYICAYIATEKEFSLTKIREYLLQYLPSYMLPSYFIKIDKIPITPNGKIDKKALPDPADNIRKKYRPPENTIENELLEIWKDILGQTYIGIDDKFLQLGGDSLKATLLISKVYDAFNVEISFLEIFRDFTVDNLYKLIRKQTNGGNIK